MDLIRASISKPVTVTVGVILLVMFGLIGLDAMPIQLSPNIDRPTIRVTTNWQGRSPEEIVDEIAKEQEEKLKNLQGLKKMKSVSREGQCEITLEFFIDTNIDRARQDVSDALRQVPQYPQDVDEPAVTTAEGASESAIAWIILDLDPEAAHLFPGFDITTLQDALDREVKPYLATIDGVAEVNIFGGREHEMRVLIDPVKLAQRGLNAGTVLEALRAENRNISAGTIAEGKRDYRIRVVGQFENEEDILDTIVAYREGGPVRVRDVGQVELGYQKQRGFVRSLGYPSIAMNVKRRAGSNVMSIMTDLRDRLEELRADILPRLHPSVGEHLRLRQVYDETIYISSSIDLVTQNLWVGGSIAALVLLMFLRSFVSTGIIAITIPISIVGTFLAMLAMGRSLNVISLAGLAFAVGMVVDNAIVVLENIYRHLHLGKSPMQAAQDGATEVWGAIVAATLTTVAVFIPILTIAEEAGQLFRDLSLAIVASVLLSLLISITVIPAACSRWLREHDAPKHPVLRAFDNLFGLVPIAHTITLWIAALVRWAITGWRAATIRPAVIVSLTIISIVAAIKIAPPMDYLPAGNRNLVFGGLLIPPGYSVDQRESIAERIEGKLRPYATVDASDAAALANLEPIDRGDEKSFHPIGIDNFFIGSFAGSMFIGATSQQEDIVLPVGQLVTNAMNEIPDAFGGARQSSLFGRGVGGGNSIDVEIAGPNLDRVSAAASALSKKLQDAPQFGRSRVRPDPGNFDLDQPEWRIEVTRAGRELGLRTENVGTVVRSLFDGAFVGDFRAPEDTYDIRLLPIGGRLEYKEQVASIPIATPAGPIVPIDQLVKLTPSVAPQEIHRIEELAAVTLLVTPPDDQPLEKVMSDIRTDFIAPLEKSGLIDQTMRVRLEGTAASLDEVKTSLFGAHDPDASAAPWQRTMSIFSLLTLFAGVLIAGLACTRCISRKQPRMLYAAAGALVLFGTLALLILAPAQMPQLATARFVWAIAVTYLLMAALFESFVLPFVIMFSVPVAVVGGFIGLAIVHKVTMADPTIQPQKLDVLTMIGFVILIGVVVNNAILIVHQSLNLTQGRAETLHSDHERLAPPAAIAEAVRTRMRPVFMSTLTSVAGMTPLVLFPGAGSELYRGLGSVVIAGLLLSTVFTLILVPLLLSLSLDMSSALRELLSRAPKTQPPSSITRRAASESTPQEPALAST